MEQKKLKELQSSHRKAISLVKQQQHITSSQVVSGREKSMQNWGANAENRAKCVHSGECQDYSPLPKVYCVASCVCAVVMFGDLCLYML